MQRSYHHSVRSLGNGVCVNGGPGRGMTTNEVTAGITRDGAWRDCP